MSLYRDFKHFLESRKLWNVFTYLFFGGLATVVNIVTFALAYRLLKLSWPISNSFSWIISVLFAFLTNKLWVFHSVTPTSQKLAWEFFKFMIARTISFGIDMLTMYVLIDLVQSNDLLAKVVTQVIVVIANYAFSKIFIFTSK